MEHKRFLDAVRGRVTAVFLIGICLIPLTSRAFASAALPLSLSETVRQADAIVLGTVAAKQSRWGDGTRRWMVTDYTFSVERVVYRSSQSQTIGQTVLLSYWGGTINGETQAISDVRLPAIGERLVMLLRPDWGGQVGITPVVGLNNGLFLAGAASGGTELVRDADGLTLALGPGGQVTRRTGAGLAQAPSVSLVAFLNWVSTNVLTIKAGPSELPPVLRGPGAIPVNAKTPAFTQPGVSGRGSSPLTGPSPAAPAAIPYTPAVDRAVHNESAVYQPDPGPNYTTNHQAHLPIVVNNFPASFAPWSPEDQYQMSKWNYYASDVFRVYTTPTDTYGWPNDVFDLDGWPSSADTVAVYGFAWDPNMVAVTIRRFDSGGWIIEADIALNPAFDFTLDDEWVYDGSSAQSFRLTMIHELGHMHGLEHNFNALSVMNYVPPQFRFFGLPYTDDAAGIRFEYPSQAVPITDLGVYLYYASGFQSVSDATYPFSVVAGNTITVNNYHVENVGTTTIATPTLEWYLSDARNYAGNYAYIGSTTFSSLAPFTYFTPSSVSTTLTVPSSVTPGDYYLSAFVRNDAGAFQGSFPFSNNFAFSRNRIHVNAPLYLLTVSKNGTGSGTVTSVPSGINCGATCSASFTQGTNVTLSASAAGASTFAGWSGAGCSGTGTCIVSMTQARSVTATFNLGQNPTVTNVTSSTANGTYAVGAVISIQVTFSAAVTVTGTPQLALNSGGTAGYTSGSGTSTLTFTYTVGAGQNSADLDYTSTAALTLNGGTIKDAALNNANLTLAAPGAAGSLGANKNLVIGTGSATIITIINGDPAGVGFNDPTAVAPIGGNTGTTLGQQRLNVFQAAANKWASVINSGVPIRVNAVWTALTCTASSAVLGSAGATEIFHDFLNAPVAGRWYPKALANKFAGSDLDPATVDIAANFNVNLGQNGCLTGVFFYLGLDNIHGTNIDFFTVLLHELGHGLGFQTFTSGSTGAQVNNIPSVWDDFLLDNVTNKTWAQMTPAERVASAINTGHLVWTGSNVTAGTSILTAGKDASNRALMYSPNPFQGGSSVSHFDTTASPNLIMEPAINGNLVHEVTLPNDLTFSLFQDIGWTGAATPAATVTNVTSSTANGTYTTGQSISIQVTLSGAVTVTGTPQLALNSGGTAGYTSGSGTSTLTFTYTIGAGQTSADLDYTSTGSLTLNGGTIKDAALNNANLTLAAPGAAGSLGANKNLVIGSGVGLPPTAGLVGYWSFNEGSGSIANDTSGNGYNGTINGATWTTGKINSGLSFNGTTNDLVTPGIALGGTLSITAWVNPAATEGGYVRIAETQVGAGFYLGTNATGTKYKFIVKGGAGATGACGMSYGCAEGGTVTSGYHLVTATFDGTTARLYVDNAQVASDTFTAPSSTSLPFHIGQYYAGGGYGWNGAIDEVRLYNRALTGAEVTTIFNYTGGGGSSDTTPPSVSITAPAANATVSATIIVTATATDNVAVAEVQFQLDGVNLGAALTTAPYFVSWNTATASNGPHSLTAIAKDTSNNTTPSTAVPVTVSNTVTGPPTVGLVGYWSLDENSGTLAHDTSGNGYNGTINGATWTTGKINSGLSFNGTTNDLFTPAIALGSTFSVTAWVKPSVAPEGVYARIAETQFGSGFYLGTNATGNGYKFIVKGGAGATGACGLGYGCADGGTVTSGYHLVTATFDGATAKLYVDNAQVASDTFIAPGSTSLPFHIGQYYAGGGYGWNGAIDEVRLYNRALTSAEVTTIFNYTGSSDSTPPSVSITAPAANATVSNTITVTATATDNVAVAEVQFQLDGVNLGAALTTAPYSISWNTATASNGPHSLTAIAKDTSNNTTTSTAVSVTVSNTVTGPPTAGLVGYWSLDENSGTLAHDTSGSGYNGTINGATWTTGKINSGLSFNGTTNDLVTPAIALGSTLSVTAWVNPAATEGGYVRIAETQVGAGFYLGTNATGTKYKFIVKGGAGATGACGMSYGCAEGGTVTSGYHLVTATFDGTTARLYVDNAQVASDTFTAPSSTSLPFHIGQYYGGGGYGWNGVIDEVRLYNRALTSAEVTTIYNYTGSSDSTPPSVSITTPAANATVSNTITVTATATDNVAVANVQFQLDGVNLGAALTTAPYSISWNTATASNGPHSLTAIAKDTSNNTTTSTAVPVTVSNSGGGPPTAGLVGYWNLDENSGTLAHDASGNGYNGTVVGATWTTGKINSGLSFNGTTNDLLTPAIALGSTFSVTAWVKPSVATEGGYARIAETQVGAGFYLGTNATGNGYKFIVKGGAGATGACGLGYGCADGGTVTSGYHLVTATFDGTTAKLYVDNAQVASDTFTAPGSTSLPFHIGQYYAGGGYGWNGAIDEVRLYNRALTSAEVTTIFNYTGSSDSTPPSVSITAPAANATVSNTITVTATATDNVAVANVQFQLDGVNLGAALTTAPYSISWNTNGASNGSHSLTAIAKDTSNNTTTSTAVPVTVSNSGGGVPTLGLVGYWNFDEGSGSIANDTSGSGSHGTVIGAAWTAGKTNSGLGFNGTTNDLVTSGIGLGSIFSISAWVNPSVATEGGYVRIAETQVGAGFYLGTNATGSKYKFIVKGGAGATGACGMSYGCAEGGTVTSGYHLVTATFDGTTAKLYVDNAQVASDTFTAPSSSSLPLHIGQYYAGGGYGWNGAIDEVRIYNRALTSAEVGVLFSH